MCRELSNIQEPILLTHDPFPCNCENIKKSKKIIKIGFKKLPLQSHNSTDQHQFLRQLAAFNTFPWTIKGHVKDNEAKMVTKPEK